MVMAPPSLPPEILEQIFCQLQQPNLHTCTLTSRSWYDSSIAYLYHTPDINGKNFDPFVAAICPSKNPHIRHNGLAELVRVLDMSRLVHDSKKSLTARLLGRLKTKLEVFVAPQSSFGINSLASISKCERLHTLDLSLISEALQYSKLFQAITPLESLCVLRLPRSFVPESDSRYMATTRVMNGLVQTPDSLPSLQYPPNLQSFHILGGIPPQALKWLRLPPSTLRSLQIEHCPRLSTHDIYTFLQKISQRTALHSLVLGPEIKVDEVGPCFANEQDQWYDLVIPPLPHLRTVDITSAHYISLKQCFPLHSPYWLYDAEYRHHYGEMRRAEWMADYYGPLTLRDRWPNLQSLTVRSLSSLTGATRESSHLKYLLETIDELYDALETQLPSLRRLSLHGQVSEEEAQERRLRELHDLLESLAREDWDRGGKYYGRQRGGIEDDDLMIREENAGVFIQ